MAATTDGQRQDAEAATLKLNTTNPESGAVEVLELARVQELKSTTTSETTTMQPDVSPEETFGSKATAHTVPIRVSCNGHDSGLLHKVGTHCVMHRYRPLSSQIQTDVYPFVNRPTCCVFQHGKRCSRGIGVLYSCREQMMNAKGEPTTCNYAVCIEHYRGNVVETIWADALCVARNVQDYGYWWLFASIFLFLANALYTPIVQTALMIVGCHPYYQCTFAACWNEVDQLFTLAVYLSAVILLFYGLGYPVGLTYLLHRRRRMLDSAFFSDEYAGKFGKDGGSVNLSEWNRFVVTDPTALATLYNTFELKWLYVPPLLLAWKVILLLPPVYLESGSFSQSVGVAVVEFAYAVFIFVTEPAISPLVDAMYKLGAAHQMVFLGLQSMNVYFQYKNNGTDLTLGMICVTFMYLFFCLTCVIYSKIAPPVKAAVHHAYLTALLSRLGMLYSAAVGLYIVPLRSEPSVVGGCESKEEAAEVPVSADDPNFVRSTSIRGFVPTLENSTNEATMPCIATENSGSKIAIAAVLEPHDTIESTIVRVFSPARIADDSPEHKEEPKGGIGEEDVAKGDEIELSGVDEEATCTKQTTAPSYEHSLVKE